VYRVWVVYCLTRCSLLENNEQCGFTSIFLLMFSITNELESGPKSFYITGMHVQSFDSHFELFVIFDFRLMLCESHFC